MVGYWAESRIFGGVVVFDRGASDQECDGMYLHCDLLGFGRTLYPPTEAQWRALIHFLHPSSPKKPPPPPSTTETECPLPITASMANGWRWYAGSAFLHYHIYRDRYERDVLPDYRPSRHKLTAREWPEVGYDHAVFMQEVARHEGKAVDEEVIRKANETLTMITPTSPKWRGPPPKLERKAYWKPPYFFDP